MIKSGAKIYLFLFYRKSVLLQNGFLMLMTILGA